MSTEDPNFQEAVRMLSFEKYSNGNHFYFYVYTILNNIYISDRFNIMRELSFYLWIHSF